MAFRFDKFTIKAQEAVQGAVELAGSRGNPQVTPVHLLQALLSEREGIGRCWKRSAPTAAISSGSSRLNCRTNPRCRVACSRSPTRS
jgi:ATP-dependent Clp protease ATP-binding subunit ClpA